MRLLIFFILLYSGQLFAQIGTGEWRLHVPAYKAIDVKSSGNEVYTAYVNGVSVYDLSSKEISLWDAITGLSDISVSCLGYSESDNSIFIGYENGNIDKLKNNRITNIPAVKLAQVQGSKRINRIVSHGDYIYAATGFSVVKIDIKKNEVRDTYYPTNGNQPILDVAFRGDSIYALTSDKLFAGYLPNPALADSTQWIVDARVPVLTDNAYEDVEVGNNELLLTYIVDGYGMDTVYRVTNTGLEVAVNEAASLEIKSLQFIDNRWVVNLFDGARMYDTGMNPDGLVYNYGFGPSHSNALAIKNGQYYVADDQYGLVETNGSSGKRIAITGPPKSVFYALDWKRGHLGVAAGGLSSIFSMYNRSGAYVFSDEEWSLYDASTLSKWQGKNLWDVLGISINPVNPEEIALGSFSGVPLTIVNRSTKEHDTLTPINSDLEFHSNGQGWVFVSDVEYDDEGNLWVLNGATDKPLKVYTKDGEWHAYNTGSSTVNKFTKRLIVDDNGNKWFTIKDIGIVGYKDAGTLDNTSDDEYLVLNSGSGTGALPSNEVNAVAVDLDGELWIGTDAGFAVLYNSNSAFGAGYGNYNAQRIKLEFEGNVEYVLGATNITDIEVDGANRKWFGTSNAGIILLSEDGLDIIEQHTTDNSPLISNNILDLEIDDNTGELYIVTDLGLVSYRTDASAGKRNYDEVTVFPNPARPDYEGLITIQGIKYNSDVKITDIAGNLVYKTTSNGGTATWNGKTLQGDKVSTGVYLIWTAPNDENTKGRKVGKVLIVN